MAVWYAVGCNAVGLAGRDRKGARAQRGVGSCFKSNPIPTALAEVNGVSFEATTRFNISTEKTGKILIKKTGKNLHKFNQNQALKKHIKVKST